MSRIHEALKKAEHDRAAAQAADAAASPTASAVALPLASDEGARSAAPSLSELETIAPRRPEFLRFDDLRSRCVQTRWHFRPEGNVFADPSFGAHGAEQFRTLRSRLYQLRGDQALRTILITSSVPAEGKTFVTSNLAHAIIRQPDRRVLMIDADLRRSRLHTTLGAPAGPGLTDYLNGTADEMAVIHRDQEENLFLIPGGKEVSNPSELLLNGRLKVLIDRVSPAFEWIIIDSPPCLPVADASILADVSDGVLLVVRAASTPTATARRACQELQTKRVVGVVLNAMEGGAAYGSYYHYGSNEKGHE
jgi:protein-tyrosine kinase